MSKIPYLFETPIPKYFRENGLLKNPKNTAFISWIFSCCSSEERLVFPNDIRVELQPYQFIFGRLKCCKETGLTENEVRTQQKRWEKLGFLKNTTNQITNKTTNRFTVYEIVLTDFLRDDHQPNNQPNNQSTTNRQPTDHHYLEDKKKRSKRSHPSIPSVNRDEVIDDFSSNLEKVEVCQGVFLTTQELEQCIKIKGSLQSVEQAIAFIMASPKRKHPITDWPNALAKWKTENKAKSNVEEHIVYAEQLCKQFKDHSDGNGWRCNMYTDKKKDIRGILFEPPNAHMEPILIPLVDVDLLKNALTLYLKGE